MNRKKKDTCYGSVKNRTQFQNNLFFGLRKGGFSFKGKNPEKMYEMIQDEVESKGYLFPGQARMTEGAFYAWRSRKERKKGGQGFMLLKPKDTKRRGRTSSPS